MRHVLSALVQNQPGVLAHVSGMLASRGFNIDSLAVGETEDPHLSRMTFVVHGDDAVLDQVRKQLDKIVTVVRVDDISSENFVERDLMLIKVQAPPDKRAEIVLLVEMFRGRVVDISTDNMMIEISGSEGKIEAFIELMRPYGILELARTGRIALVRGRPPSAGDRMSAKPAMPYTTRPIAPSWRRLLERAAAGQAHQHHADGARRPARSWPAVDRRGRFATSIPWRPAWRPTACRRTTSSCRSSTSPRTTAS